MPSFLSSTRRFGRGSGGEPVMGRLVEGGEVLLCLRPLHQFQKAGHGPVEHRLVQLAGLDRGHDLGIADAQVRRHLEVKAGGQRRHPVGNCAPVGHDQPGVAPLVAQHLGEQPIILGRVGAVDLVVGAHHGPRIGGLDDVLERGEVDLAEGALVHVGAHPQPVGLLIVGRVVLDAGTGAGALNAFDEGGPEHGRDVWVLGEVLEVAAAQRRALDVDARTQEDRHLFRSGLGAERHAHVTDQIHVPGRAQGGRRREARGGYAPADAGVVGLLGLLAQPVRSVGDHDRRNA
jgi:hypothetical protein